MIWAKSKFSKFWVLGGHRGYRGTIGVLGGKKFLKIEVVQKCVETRFLEFEGENRKFFKIEQVSPLLIKSRFSKNNKIAQKGLRMLNYLLKL